MRAAGAGAGALEQLRQQREDRRRVAAGGRRLAGGQADLALGHGDAGERCPSSAATSWPWSRNHSAMRVAMKAARSRTSGRLVGGRDDHDRAGQALGAEVVLEELAHLAAALADQGDARETAASVPRAIIDSRLDLPTPEPANMPRRWPRPHGHEGVERAHAERQRLCRPAARPGASGARSSTPTGRTSRSGGPPSIGRPRPSSTRPSSAGADRHAAAAPPVRDARLAGAGRRRSGPSGMQVQPVAVDGDDLGQHARRRRSTRTQLADGGVEPGDVDDRPDAPVDPAGARAGGRPRSRRASCVARRGPGEALTGQHRADALERGGRAGRRRRGAGSATASPGASDGSATSRTDAAAERRRAGAVRRARRGRSGCRRTVAGPSSGAAAPARGARASGRLGGQLELAADDGLGDRATARSAIVRPARRSDRCRRGRPARRRPSQPVGACDDCASRSARRRPRARGAAAPRRRRRATASARRGQSCRLAVPSRAEPRARPARRRRRRPPRAPRSISRAAGAGTGAARGWCAGRRRCRAGAGTVGGRPEGPTARGAQATNSSSLPAADHDLPGSSSVRMTWTIFGLRLLDRARGAPGRAARSPRRGSRRRARTCCG